ncbi:MAG TPA: DNA-binding protein [Candidatus Saccharimonadia bacterium]|nr:DNA-binding protein [Candidatus Saccharimonadia bacterium]
MTNINEQEELKDQSFVAKYLGVKEGTLEDWRYRRRKGESAGPDYIRVTSQCIRYRMSDVVAFVEARVDRAVGA